ncbi:ankyrin repeat-containing protein [Borealpox virus]|nr:ankyrin repeat-containing protein [Alaskapox virus]
MIDIKNNSIFKDILMKSEKNDLDMNIVKDFLANGYDLTVKDNKLNTVTSAYFKRDIMNLEMIDILNDYLILL